MNNTGKITKSLSPRVTDEQLQRGGLTNYCSWERLKPLLQQAAGIKHTEEIIGITADRDGITIHIQLKEA